MVPLLKEGSKGIEELKQKAHDLGLILSDETIVNAHDFDKATDSLKATWKATRSTVRYSRLSTEFIPMRDGRKNYSGLTLN